MKWWCWAWWLVWWQKVAVYYCCTNPNRWDLVWFSRSKNQTALIRLEMLRMLLLTLMFTMVMAEQLCATHRERESSKWSESQILFPYDKSTRKCSLSLYSRYPLRFHVYARICMGCHLTHHHHRHLHLTGWDCWAFVLHCFKSVFHVTCLRACVFLILRFFVFNLLFASFTSHFFSFWLAGWGFKWQHFIGNLPLAQISILNRISKEREKWLRYAECVAENINRI